MVSGAQGRVSWREAVFSAVIQIPGKSEAVFSSGLLSGLGVYSAPRCVCVCWGRHEHLKPDKGMSQISILQGSRSQVGPKEWPPCPWSSPPPLICLPVPWRWGEIGRSLGTNEVTLYPGI